MRSLFAATLLAATALVSVEPAHAQGCLTAEACRAIRMQQQAMQDQAAANAQQQAAVAAQQRQRAEVERKHATEAQARALVVRQEADARAAALAVQQQQDAHDRQQAAIQQAKLDAEQQATAQRDAEAKARLQEETRLANLRVAEDSPDNHCKERSTAGMVIESYNSLVRAGDAAFTAVDIEHLITEQFDAKAKTMSCHGTFVLTNGSRRDGSIIAHPNVAGTIIVTFHQSQY
jgi:hypothetical protein